MSISIAALRRLFSSRGPAETSRLIVGSTGSGKSEGELVEVVRLADRGKCAVVLLDGHGPLAFRAAGHWAARGHESRLVYEPLDATDRVLCWNPLRRSDSPAPAVRRLKDAETRDDVAQCFLAHRDLVSLADRPLTREWVEAAIDLCLAQPRPVPLASVPEALRPGTRAFSRLLRDADRADVVEKFCGLERVRRRSEWQFEGLCGAARRLVEPVCLSEPVRLRGREGPFDWLAALREGRLVAFDGGGVRSREIKRTLFLLASMGVIHAVRRHFAETRSPLPVVLVLEEVGALGLATPFVFSALQELRKAGLAIHLLTQSSLDFGDRFAFEALLANTPCQTFYQCLSPADQDVGARALCNATFDPLAIHFTRARTASGGVERLATESAGESFDAHGVHAGRDRRSGTTFVPRTREVDEHHYKSPDLQEQEYRTRLATLRVGERYIRDRLGVRHERVRPLYPPHPRRDFEARTREVVARVRQQPCYLPTRTLDQGDAADSLLGAAERLRTEGGDPRDPFG